MQHEIDQLRDLEDPLEQAIRAGVLLDRAQDQVDDIRSIRRAAVERILDSGASQSEAGQMIGLSRARIGQIISKSPRAERSFFGSGRVAVALGGKYEAGKATPGVTIAREDMASFAALQELLKDLGLSAESEVVEPTGFVDLNRPNLIVICGPRLSPVIAQILAVDRNLGFSKDGQGWFLADRNTNTEYRSPQDRGERGDIAYFGRLPRPDQQGHFLYMAGIHAAGPQGVIHWLGGNISDLYKEVKSARFSMLIESDFATDGSVVASRQITPTYKG